MSNYSSVNICFFGINRCLSDTINSINKYLFNSLESLGVEYSVYGAFVKVDSFSNERTREFSAKPQLNESSLIKFDDLKYVDQSAVDDLIKWDHVFRFGDTYDQVISDEDLRKNDSTTKNVFRSLFTLKSAFLLVPLDLLDRPTIFVRPDLEILSEIDFELYISLLAKHNAKYAYGKSDGVCIFPSWHSWDGLNDRFAICSPGNAADAYAKRFDSLYSYLDISKHPLHPELFLHQIMRASRVEALPIMPTRMVRIRADGNPQVENFSSGLRCFDQESRSFAALHKVIEERGAEVITLQKQLEDLKLLFDPEQNKLKQLILTRENELEEEKNAKIAKEKVINILDEKNASLMNERDEVKKKYEVLNKKIIFLDKEINEYQKKVEILDIKNTKLANIGEEYQEKVEILEAKITTLFKESEEYQKEVEISDFKNTELAKKSEEYQEKVEILEAKITSLFKESEESQASVDRLSQELSSIKADCDVYLTDKKNAQKSVELLRRQLDAEVQRIKALEEASALSIRQLHLVQNELEEYYILSQEQSALLEANADLQDKAVRFFNQVVK